MALAVAGCSSRLVREEHGRFQGAKLFAFSNFIVIEARSASEATFDFAHYQHPDPFGMFDRLIITSSGGKCTVTNKHVRSGAIEVNGKKYRVPPGYLVVIDGVGKIQVIQSKVRHPGIPRRILDTERTPPK